MPEILAGIDVGTSGVKAGVFDAAGTLLGAGRAPHRIETPHPGWAESDPDGWWRALVHSLGAACDSGGVEPEDIAAVGLSVFYPAIAPLDASGHALNPAILYCDQRSLAQVARIEESVVREEYEGLIGNRLVPGTCAVTSMAWLRDERPDAYAASRVLGFANTVVIARLTSEFATDPSNASTSGLVDIRDPWRWSGDLCAKAGIDESKLPRIVGSSEVAGPVTDAAAAETGLAAGTPVVAGCGDAVASSVGAGLVSGETAVYIAGSSDCVNVPMTRPTVDRTCVNSAYVSRGSWLGIGTSTSSGASVGWFAREFMSGDETLSTMTELAAASAPGANGVVFTPYLQGERTPIWDPQARGAFLGLSLTTTRADLARAVLEGTAFSLRQIVESIERSAGTRPSEMRAVGGGTRNALWNQIKADVLQRELRVLHFQETGTLGAALLAGIASGAYASFEDAAGVADNRTDEVVEPDFGLVDVYEKSFELYREVHERTSAITHGLAGMSSDVNACDGYPRCRGLG